MRTKVTVLFKKCQCHQRQRKTMEIFQIGGDWRDMRAKLWPWTAGPGRQSLFIETDLEKIKNLLEQNKLFIIDSNDKGTKEPTIKFADELGMNIDDVREGISGALGYILGQLFTNPSLGTLFITGGDTLLQCMNTIGVKELEPVCEIQKGVVLSKFTFNGCSKYVISKSGGFGKNTLFLEILEKIVHTKNMWCCNS